MSLTKTAVNKLLVAERKSMRAKQKQSAFMRKTLNIYNGMKRRAAEFHKLVDFTIDEFRADCRDRLDMGVCPYCAGELKLTTLAVDHCNPVSRGGSFGLENLDYCCKPCNWQKGGVMDRGQFILFLRHLRTSLPIAAVADIKRRLTIGGKWSFKN